METQAHPRFISIPLKGCQEDDEVIEINCDELPDGEEVLGILQTEEAKLSFWIEVALEYYRHRLIDDFLRMLEFAGSLAYLEYGSVTTDQMRALDILAAHWMSCGYRERSKEKRQELFQKATVLFNTADKISMYEWSHLTVRAWFYLFEKENRAGKLDLADQQFNFVVKTHPENVLPLIGKGVIAFNKKDIKMSIFYFRKAIRQKRTSVADLRVGLGYCFAKLGKPEKAKIAFERAMEIDDKNVSAMTGLGIILMNTLEPENFQQAITLFARAYHNHPEHPVALVHLANHFFFKREYERVQQLAWHAMTITDSEPIKAEACFQLARLKHAQGQYDGAFKYYYQSKSLDNGEHTLAYYGLGQLYIHRGELEEAIKCFEKVHERMPNNAETIKILGSLYAHVAITDPTSELETRQKGRDALQKYLTLVPDDIEVSIDLAQLLESLDPQRSLELYERAIDLLKTIEDIEPQPEMMNNVGALHMHMKDYEKAKDYFEQARDRLQEMIETEEREESDKPQLLTIRYNLARCLEHLCKTTEAELLYKDIISMCPNYIDCYMRLGCLTRDRGQIYDSSVWFKNALQFDQTSADAWTLIGNLHMSKNEWQPAQKKFEHILTKNGQSGSLKNPDAYSLIALGNVWLEQLMNPNRKKDDEKKYVERSQSMYVKALKLQPRNMYAANGLGCVLAFKKTWMEARDVFSQVREATSDFYDVWINIAHVYMEKDQYMPAIQMYTSAMKKFQHENDPAMLHYLAKAYYKADKLDEAKEALERALLEAVDNIQLKFNYAVVLKKSAKEVMRSIKMTTQQVNNAIGDLKAAERIFTYISINEDTALPGAKLLSRSLCRDEAGLCRDLLVQANHKLETAQLQDEEERKLREKQEEELELLKKRIAEDKLREEEEKKKKLEEMKTLRSTFVEMTKDILRLPEVPQEKRGGGGGGRGRRRKGEDGDEFVNDSSDNENYRGEDGEEGEGGGGGERRKKDKSAKKASRKRREKKGRDSGSDGEGRADKKKRRKEEREKKMAEKMSAKQSAKIKSRAFVSSDESSDDGGGAKKRNNRSDDDDDDEPPKRDEFADSPPPPRIRDSDDDDDSDESGGEKKPKKSKKKTVMDSDDSSGSGSDNGAIIGASSDDDDAPGTSSKKQASESDDNKGSDDSDVPSRKKKKRAVSSDASEASDSD